MKPTPLKLWVLLALLISGCGYHLVGTGTSLPDHLRTLYIPIFKNTSSQPDIHRDLTSSVINSFITDGRVKIAPREKADMELKAELFFYELRAVSFSSNDFVSDYIVELGVNLKVIDNVKGKTYMEDKFNTQWDYKASSDIVDTESARLAALELAYKELGNRLVGLVIDQF